MGRALHQHDHMPGGRARQRARPALRLRRHRHRLRLLARGRRPRPARGRRLGAQDLQEQPHDRDQSHFGRRAASIRVRRLAACCQTTPRNGHSKHYVIYLRFYIILLSYRLDFIIANYIFCLFVI